MFQSHRAYVASGNRARRQRATQHQGGFVMSIVLVDAGGTNIGSVRYALQRLGADAQLTADAATIRRADKVILPGVGAAGPGMARLRALELVEVLRGLTQPVLGVCLGMQLLSNY